MNIIANFLSQAAHHSPSPDNTQPWRLNWQNNTLTVTYDTQRVAANTFAADSHATLLTMGALLENLTQAAALLNVNIDWHFPQKLNTQEPVYFQACVDRTTINSPPLPLEAHLFKRHTNRFPFKNKPLPNDCAAMLKNLTLDSIRILLIEDKPNIQLIADLVKEASEIRFQTRECHEWLEKSLRFDVKSTDVYGEGLDVKTIDMPPGGNLLLRYLSDWQRMKWFNKIGGFKAMATIESRPISMAPAIIAFVGPNQFRNTLSTGQLMNRAWIALNAQGIAVHPYYVITDQLQRRQNNSVPLPVVKNADILYEKTRGFFQLGDDETLHMLFRVGYPFKIPIKSKRLPLTTVSLGI